MFNKGESPCTRRRRKKGLLFFQLITTCKKSICSGLLMEKPHLYDLRSAHGFSIKNTPDEFRFVFFGSRSLMFPGRPRAIFESGHIKRKLKPTSTRAVLGTRSIGFANKRKISNIILNHVLHRGSVPPLSLSSQLVALCYALGSPSRPCRSVSWSRLRNPPLDYVQPNTALVFFALRPMFVSPRVLWGEPRAPRPLE